MLAILSLSLGSLALALGLCIFNLESFVCGLLLGSFSIGALMHGICDFEPFISQAWAWYLQLQLFRQRVLFMYLSHEISGTGFLGWEPEGKRL